MKSVVALALAATFSGHAMAGPSEDEAESRKVLDDYVTSYSSLDAHRTSLYFNEPCTFVAADGVQVKATRAEVEASLAPFFARLKARAYGHSEFSSANVRYLADGLVIASARIVRHKIDGSELETLGATYLLRKTLDGWRIAVTTTHPAATALSLQ